MEFQRAPLDPGCWQEDSLLSLSACQSKVLVERAMFGATLKMAYPPSAPQANLMEEGGFVGPPETLVKETLSLSRRDESVSPSPGGSVAGLARKSKRGQVRHLNPQVK